MAHLAPNGALRRLRPWEGRLYAEHLARLPAESRHRRFHGEIGSDALQEHAARVVKDPNKRVFGWFQDGLPRGAAEIALSDREPIIAECAFAVEPARAASLRGQRVVLIDDVMTTGATLHAATLALREAGVAHVTAAVLARTGLD